MGGLHPPKFGQLRFFGQQEKFGQSQFLKKFACVWVCCFFFPKRDIFYFKLKSAWLSQLNSHETVVAQHVMSFWLFLKGKNRSLRGHLLTGALSVWHQKTAVTLSQISWTQSAKFDNKVNTQQRIIHLRNHRITHLRQLLLFVFSIFTPAAILPVNLKCSVNSTQLQKQWMT